MSSSWIQWVKNNNRPNFSQESKRVLAWPSSPYSNYPWSFFFFMGNLVAHDVMAILLYLWFIYALFFFYINLKNVCVNVVKQNAKVLDKELNLLWLGFLWMVFNMLLAFHINLIKIKCYIQHTYAIFFFIFLLTF